MDIHIIDAKPEHAHDISYVHVNAWKAAYKGVVPNSYLDEMNVENRAQRFIKNYEQGYGILLFA